MVAVVESQSGLLTTFSWSGVSSIHAAFSCTMLEVVCDPARIVGTAALFLAVFGNFSRCEEKSLVF